MGDLYVGIDPGLSGYLVAITAEKRVVEAWQMETYTETVGKKKRRRYNIPAISKLLSTYSNIPSSILVVLEQQESFPGQSSQAGFSTGFGMGVWEALLVDHELSYQKVRPSVWKRAMGATVKAPGNTFSSSAKKRMAKERSVAVALSLFPGYSLVKKGAKKPNDDLAEALLLAEYARRLESSYVAGPV